MKKKILVMLMAMPIMAFDPISTPKPAIDSEIEAQEQRIHEAMTRVDEIEKQIQIVEQKKIQMDPASDVKPLDRELQRLHAEMKQAKEVARVEKNKLNQLQHGFLDLQKELSK